MTTESRNRAVTQYIYLCAQGARKFCRPGLDVADLQQIAAVGLIKACDRYDRRLRTPFTAFAWLFIVGELMHYVRDNERLVRAPRRLNEMYRRVEHVSDRLRHELLREPSAQEIARVLGASGRDLEDLRRLQRREVPLYMLRHAQLRAYSYTLDDFDGRILVDAALMRLSKTERAIILALYRGGYSQVEVASSMGYSRRHVSRLHRMALKKMQPYLF